MPARDRTDAVLSRSRKVYAPNGLMRVRSWKNWGVKHDSTREVQARITSKLCVLTPHGLERYDRATGRNRSRYAGSWYNREMLAYRIGDGEWVTVRALDASKGEG